MPTEQIKLSSGKFATVPLKGLLTAGYEWTFTVEGDKDCIAISKELAIADKPSKKIGGTSADEIFTIKGKKTGTAIIHFIQKRSWEKDTDPVNEKRVKVVVG